MFDLTKEVPSLELCKRLKELGYPQDGGGWYWIKTTEYSNSNVNSQWILVRSVYSNKIDDLWRFKDWDESAYSRYWKFDAIYKAPTVRELGEWLPEVIFSGDTVYFIAVDKNSPPLKREWVYSYNSQDDILVFKKRRERS